MNITLSHLREFRIIGFTLFDTVLAFAAVALLSPFLSRLFRKFGLDIPMINWIFLTLPVSILTHLAIGRRTPLVKDFIDPNGHYVVKIIIVVLFILSFTRISRTKSDSN